MPRLRLLLILAALLGVLVAGCSDDDQGSEGADAGTAAETAPVEKPKANGRSGKTPRKAGKVRGKAAKRRPTEAELARERRAIEKEEAEDKKDDREFDRSFKQTPFEETVATLPIRKPPLFVQQYITDGNTVYTAVAPKRFFCGRSPARRKVVVAQFYRDADRRFRRRGIENFVKIVTPVAETLEELPALAIGRKGSVSLTKRGRAKGPC